MNEYQLLKECFQRAKLGSFLVLPLKYDAAHYDDAWLRAHAQKLSFTTMDINESVKTTLTTANIVTRYGITRQTIREEFFDGMPLDDLYVCEKGQKQYDDAHRFSLLDMEIYIFHTQVAFLCIKIRYSDMTLLRTLSSLGYAENPVDYMYTDPTGALCPFDLQEKLLALCACTKLTPFFSINSSLFLEAYTYTTALIEQRFQSLETIRQAVFNLHLMTNLEEAAFDEAEEDVNYVYAVKDQSKGSYRWGCCVTSQTTSYVVADDGMNIEKELAEQAENGLPIVVLALYQKYTCLRFKDLVAIMDKKKSKRLRRLKKQLLEFQAYGTIAPANISRWHNIRQIYVHLLETNGIGQAIEDISVSLNLLSEHEEEIAGAKTDAIMGLLSIFSVFSIPSAIIGVVDLLRGGNSFHMIATMFSLVSVVMVIIVMALYKDRT